MIVPSDTIVEGLAIFSANERYDSYEWQIGYDTRVWTDSSFSLRFPSRSLTLGEPIPIRFIGRRTPRRDCFPDDDGVDTAYRFLVSVGQYSSPIFGSYRGYHVDEPSDTFTVSIFWRNEDALSMRNIDRSCMDTSARLTQVDKYLGATVLLFDGSGTYDGRGCKNPKGVLRLSNGNDVEIDYVYDHARMPKKFIGRSVP